MDSTISTSLSTANMVQKLGVSGTPVFHEHLRSGCAHTVDACFAQKNILRSWKMGVPGTPISLPTQHPNLKKQCGEHPKLIDVWISGLPWLPLLCPLFDT